MSAFRWIVPSLAAVLLLLAGCGGDETSVAPPSGWAGNDTRMWKESVDTSAVFRDLHSLTAMGILENEFAVSGERVTQDQFREAIKRTLEALYRSNPPLVDSLFQEHAVPELQTADLGRNAVQRGRLNESLRQTYKQRSLQAIDEHYQRPTMQKGIENLTYPDSLRTEEHSGEVEVQVHINEQGQIDAVEVIRGTHPTLDAIVMRAAANTTWQPAFVTIDGTQVSYPGWARLSTTFPAPR